MNIPLIIGGCLSLIAAVLHVAIIFGGASWYRFFGAGERMAIMAEKGSWIPVFITGCIALVLAIWAVYAFFAAGLFRSSSYTLPFMEIVLWSITLVYLLRGLAVLPLLFLKSAEVDSFVLWSSLIVLIYGVIHLWGVMTLRLSSFS